MNTQAISRKSVTVTLKAHSGEGEYVDGIYAPADKISYEKQMAMMPVSVDDLEYFDKQDAEEKFTVLDRKFYDNLMDVDVEENDIIEKDGIEYEIVRVLDRSSEGYRIYFGKAQE